MWPAIKRLAREQRGDILSAIMCYQVGEEMPDMDPVTAMAFEFIRAQMDRDNEKYGKTVEKRRAAAQKRWNNGSYMQMHANAGDTDTDNVTVTDTDTDTDTGFTNVNIKSLSNMPIGMAEELRGIYGDRADGLIEDVRRYYSQHLEKEFPGWPEAMAQFNANQLRWGKATKKQSSTDRAFEAFKAEIEAEEKK